MNRIRYYSWCDQISAYWQTGKIHPWWRILWIKPHQRQEISVPNSMEFWMENHGTEVNPATFSVQKNSLRRNPSQLASCLLTMMRSPNLIVVIETFPTRLMLGNVKRLMPLGFSGCFREAQQDRRPDWGGNGRRWTQLVSCQYASVKGMWCLSKVSIANSELQLLMFVVFMNSWGRLDQNTCYTMLRKFTSIATRVWQVGRVQHQCFSGFVWVHVESILFGAVPGCAERRQLKVWESLRTTSTIGPERKLRQRNAWMIVESLRLPRMNVGLFEI